MVLSMHGTMYSARYIQYHIFTVIYFLVPSDYYDILGTIHSVSYTFGTKNMILKLCSVLNTYGTKNMVLNVYDTKQTLLNV